MLKIPPIPYGSDQITLLEPVRVEADFRNRTIQIWLGAAIEDASGVSLGVLDTMGERATFFEFPILDKQIVLQDPQHLDPATTDLFEHLRAALEPFLLMFFQRKGEEMKQETFRVGRASAPVALTWEERDVSKHQQIIEKVERPLSALPVEEKVIA